MLAGAHQPVYASGECEIDLARRELRILGSAVPIGGRAFEILEVLAQSAGELVTKDELMNRVWPDAIVMENTLQVHAAAVRKALGPFRGLLKTESRRGYRLHGDWTVRRDDAAKPPVGLRQIRVTGDSPATNFPAVVTPLIGRSAAQQRLQDLVSAYRVVTSTTPLANDAGVDILRRARDPSAAKKKLAEAGYGGDPIVVIAPTELAGIRALSLIGAEQMRRAGLNVDLQEMEFCAVVERRTSQSPPNKGGWNVFFTMIDRSIPNIHPFGNPALRADGKAAYDG
jgi:DNA-binding winged helix-turn-helix (wHTH) protein